MATGYHLEVGYLSGYSTKHNGDSAWDELKRVVIAVADNPLAIYAEARNFNAPDVCPCGCGATLMEHCEVYREQGFGSNGVFAINEDERYVILIASGSREMKEHTRRAFCRLVLYQMHKQGIEVSLHVG